MRRITSQSFGPIVGLVVALILGVGVGAILSDIPHLELKKDVDVGALVSLAGLLAAIYIIPYVIDRSFAKRRHKSGLLLSEIDSAISRLTDFIKQFRSKYFKGKNLSQEDIQMITLDARSITNLLDGLTQQSSTHRGLEAMRSDVFDEFNLQTVTDYTDSIRAGKPITQDAVLKASKSTEEIIAKLRNYRYLLGSE